MSYSKLIADTNETIGAIEIIYMADHLSRGLVDRKQQCPKQVPYLIFVMIIHIVMPFIIDTNNESERAKKMEEEVSNENSRDVEVENKVSCLSLFGDKYFASETISRENFF